MNRLVTITLGIAVVLLTALAVVDRQALSERVPAVGALLQSIGLATPPDPAAKAEGKNARQPTAVVIEAAAERDVPAIVEAVGTAQPMLTVAIRPRVDSQIERVHVVEGARVQAGDLLFTLDSRMLNAQLVQLEAQLAKDRAQLEQAGRDAARYQELAERNATTRVNLENSQTAIKVLNAQVSSTEASIANVRTQISFTEIRAPANGRLGAIQAKAGSIVRQNDTTPLVVINQVDPIYVQFALPQTILVDLRRAMATGTVAVSAMAGDRELSGEVAFMENTVDVATGTISVKARIANTDELIWPGAFSRVKVTLGVDRNAVVVPSAAVQMGLKGPYVFVVKDNKAELKPVEVKRTFGSLSVLAGGVKGGEQVVIDGQLRLVNGAPVTAKAKPPAVASQPARS